MRLRSRRSYAPPRRMEREARRRCACAPPRRMEREVPLVYQRIPFHCSGTSEGPGFTPIRERPSNSVVHTRYLEVMRYLLCTSGPSTPWIYREIRDGRQAPGYHRGTS